MIISALESDLICEAYSFPNAARPSSSQIPNEGTFIPITSAILYEINSLNNIKFPSKLLGYFTIAMVPSFKLQCIGHVAAYSA